jgi:hypothetical protein
MDAFIEAGTTRKRTAEELGRREELGRALAEAQTALQGGSDADLLAALDLGGAVSSLADALRPTGD